MFEKAASDDATPESWLELARRFDPQYFKNWGEKTYVEWMEAVKFYDHIVGDGITDEDYYKSVEDYEKLYYDVMTYLSNPEGMDFNSIDDLPQANFKCLLIEHMPISIILYAYLPKFFLPNFFVMQFTFIRKFTDKYDIDLPKTPNRSDYKGRCFYYFEICRLLTEFGSLNGLTQSELCAFLFSYELPVIKEESELEYQKPSTGIPEQAWILVGNYGESERDMTYGFWQANQLTTKGDILLFYEKSPVKKLNSVWIAQEDGVVDPFFYFHSNTYIGNKISIPNEQAISFEDFKNSEYFKYRDKKGNFVSKNFQDCSGWAVTSEDYKEIKRMLESKGFDTSVLPTLYEPNGYTSEDVKNEDDVYKKMVTPLLEEMGWKEGVDFKREVEFAAGHSTTGHAMNKRPDYCLHISGTGRELTAKVIIEAKYLMKNSEDVKNTFEQGLSYAKWGGSEVLVICDKQFLYVYEKKKGKFSLSAYERFSWDSLGNLDTFNELKRLLK